MQPEPEREIEKTLRDYSAVRQRFGGERLSLPEHTRQLLLREAARLAPTTSRPSGFNHFMKSISFRIGFALLVVLVIAGIALRPSRLKTNQTDVITSSAGPAQFAKSDAPISPPMAPPRSENKPTTPAFTMASPQEAQASIPVSSRRAPEPSVQAASERSAKSAFNLAPPTSLAGNAPAPSSTGAAAKEIPVNVPNRFSTPAGAAGPLPVPAPASTAVLSANPAGSGGSSTPPAPKPLNVTTFGTPAATPPATMPALTMDTSLNIQPPPGEVPNQPALLTPPTPPPPQMVNVGGFSSPSVGGGLTTQKFVRVRPTAKAEVVAQTAGGAAGKTNPLENFKVQLNGEQILIIDADGSTYEGIMNRRDQGPEKGLDRVVRSFAIPSPTTPTPNGTADYFFRAEGTNRSLNVLIRFSGDILTGLNVTNSSRLRAGSSPGSTAGNVPLAGSSVRGRMRIGSGGEVPIEAETVDK